MDGAGEVDDLDTIVASLSALRSTLCGTSVHSLLEYSDRAAVRWPLASFDRVIARDQHHSLAMFDMVHILQRTAP